MNSKRPCRLFGFFILYVISCFAVAQAQFRQEPGHSIGKVTTQGNLILLELDENALGTSNMFDLTGRTLHFTRDGGGYRVENVALQWDSEFGTEASGPLVTLKNFQFPFSDKTWDTFSVGANGSIRLGTPETNAPQISGVPGGRFGGGVQIGRFDQLQEAGRNLVNSQPAICVFMKPRMSGKRYIKEMDDRVVVTWDVTEPFGNIQDFTWAPTVNRFQAVLHKDGAIDMSYNQLAAKDAVVGVYPLVTAGVEKEVGSIKSAAHPSVAENLDVTNVRVTSVDGLFLKVTLETRGAVIPEGDAKLAGVTYRINFDTHKPAPKTAQDVHADAVWTIRGFAGGGRGGPRGGSPRYIATGPGFNGPGSNSAVKVSGKTISIQGALPAALKAGEQVSVSVESASGSPPETAAQIAPKAIALSGLRSPEVDLSSLKKQDGPFTVVYESFHYFSLPNPRDLTCSVIKALGDKFDFLAYYSDFRVDNQEAGTPSTGPLGSTGPAVTGIGATQRGLDAYCSAGRFQWQFIQPVYSGSVQMQERPPEGAPVGPDRDITFYARQLSERSQDGKMPPYMYGMSQIAHEMGHRWGAFVSAKVGNETIPLGPTHWARGLQAQVAYPYQRPTEASIMGGSVWQDNFDGTYTQLDDDYYVPATGWSYLDLYLMGLISPAEVPDFFILRNITPAGRDANGRPLVDANGHPIVKADRTKVTIQDVIAAEGPRTPDVEHSQRKFNTGMVMVVEHGKAPSRELIEGAEGIRKQWIDYWPATTGGRVSMTADPR